MRGRGHFGIREAPSCIYIYTKREERELVVVAAYACSQIDFSFSKTGNGVLPLWNSAAALYLSECEMLSMLSCRYDMSQKYARQTKKAPEG
jgi:hypothetical protein